MRAANSPPPHQSDELPKPPPGKWQEALLGMIGRREQHEAGVDQHDPASRGGEAAVEDQVLANVAAGPEIAAEAIDVGPVEAQAIEGRCTCDLAFGRQGALVRINPRPEKAVVADDVAPALRKVVEERLEGSAVVLERQEIVIVRS